MSDDSFQLNESQDNLQDNDDVNSPDAVTAQVRHSTCSDCSPSAFDQVEDNDCEEETDQNIYTTTVAKPMLSVRVHTEPPSDLAAVPTESPTKPKIIFPL